MEPAEPYDPEATAFRAVAELERKGFTKGEIADALTEAWASIGVEADERRNIGN